MNNLRKITPIKTKLILLGFLLITTFGYGQINSRVDEMNIKYTVVEIDSGFFLNEKRTIKISLPKNYDETKKYPVVYTLDGSSLFEMVAGYTKILGNQMMEDDYDLGTNVIPPVITVGIFHNDRNYETQPNFKGIKYLEGPDKLKDFLIYQVIPYVNTNYSTSGYNSIIGHSNTAFFTTSLLFQSNNPFKGIIALSLVEGSTEFQKELTKTLNSKLDENYFLGYGSKDNEFNWMAKKIDQEIANENVQVKMYNANHTDLPASSLVDGIKYMFKEYRNFEGFSRASGTQNFDVKIYLETYHKKIKDEYGVDAEIIDDDFGYLLVEAISDKNSLAFDKLVKYDEERNGFKYQPIIMFHYRKDLGDFIEAKKIAYQMLESNDENVSRFLLAQLDAFSDFFIDNLNSPKEAIQFLESGKERFPEHILAFSYFIAKTCFDNDYQRSLGEMNLKYCVNSFRENRYFTQLDLEAMK
jgi:predicted alpha/beta superfamily hydrolase